MTVKFIVCCSQFSRSLFPLLGPELLNDHSNLLIEERYYVVHEAEIPSLAKENHCTYIFP